MAKRRNGSAGFGAAVAMVIVVAAAFAGFLYWRSEMQEQSPAPEPTASAVAVPAAQPSPTPLPVSGSAHPLEADERLPLGGPSAVRYTVNGGAVTFQFEVGSDEWPSIDADVNQNGAVDANVDRSYTIATDGSYCAQYLTSASTWSECGGAPSGGRASVQRRGRTRTVVLTIPADELSNTPEGAHVAFKLCHKEGGAWQCLQSPGGRTDVGADFADAYLIKLQ